MVEVDAKHEAHSSGVRKKCEKKKDEVVPGIELGLPESESDVLTITLYNHVVEADLAQTIYNLQMMIANN